MITESQAAAPARPSAIGGVGTVGSLLAGVAALLALAAGRATESTAVDGHGIISALPLLYWFAVVMAVVATGLLLHAALHGRGTLAIGIPALWLLVAHTAPALAHSFARFSTVYTHLGFVRLIDSEGTGDILVDARFAWPGFIGAFIPSLPSLDPTILDWFLRLWPTVVLGASAVLVAALARRCYPTRRLIGPLSSSVFLLLAWTGQGYFSPQSAGFLFYLSIIVVLESGPLRSRGAWSSAAPILSRFATAGGDRPEARSTASFVALLLLSFGAVVSHPLASFFICAALAMLGFYGRAVAWRLLLIVGAASVIWVLVAAEPWWSTRVEGLSSQFGSLLSNFESSTSDGSVSSSEAHLLVTRVRAVVGLTTFASVVLAAVVMATDRFRHLRPTLPLAPLAGIPVAVAALQGLSGETVIWVLLFALPMASILTARLLLGLPKPVIPTAVAALTAGIIPVFLVARFGNEAFEMVVATDREAVEVMYDNAADGTVFIADNPYLPWGDRLRESNDHLYSEASPTDGWLEEVRALAADARAGRVIVVLTRSQSAWREHVDGAPPDSLDGVGRWLTAQPDVETLYVNHGAWVLALPIDP